MHLVKKNGIKSILLNVLLNLSLVSAAQNQTNIWYFGDQAGLDFNSGVPVPLLDSEMTTQEGCATIADANGDLLFYTRKTTTYSACNLVAEL